MNQRNRYKKESTALIYANNELKEVTEYKHLGITQNKRRNTPANVDTVRQSSRSTLFSLVNCGIHSNGINPITASKLYMSTVLPRALYGCELWNNITQTDMAHLEATHHFWLKRIQNLPVRTRSDMAIGLLGFTSLSAYIDLQKLLFMGSLCRLQSTDVASQVFIRRLFQFKNNCTELNRGFIPDVLTILKKYNLVEHFDLYSSTGSFPTKYKWKAYVNATFLRKNNVTG